jgi:methylmalonyl-CoA/ethylmalonyl-CoA epimerase
MFGWPIDHVALAVADLEESAKLYARLGFTERYRERITDQDIDIIGMHAGDATIELLKPLSADSPLRRFLGDKPSRLHHVGYRVDNVDAEIKRLKALGMRLIDETPRPGAHGNLIAFIHPTSTGGTLIELCQSVVP